MKKFQNQDHIKKKKMKKKKLKKFKSSKKENNQKSNLHLEESILKEFVSDKKNLLLKIIFKKIFKII